MKFEAYNKFVAFNKLLKVKENFLNEERFESVSYRHYQMHIIAGCKNFDSSIRLIHSMEFYFHEIDCKHILDCKPSLILGIYFCLVAISANKQQFPNPLEFLIIVVHSENQVI